MINKKNILKKPIPRHIAIILDGNGRWAKKKGMPRNLGHRQGAINLKDIVLECNSLGIEVVTVYAFSTENWNRPKEEIDYLMTEPVKGFKENKEKIIKSGIRISFIGKRDRISKELLLMLEDIEKSTSKNKGTHLVIAADYGSQYELTEMTKNISSLVREGKVKIKDIDTKLIEENLYTKDLPQLDLLIRTSGEIRISNFLLWQLSYSELYFTKVYWPAFSKKELYKSIISYQNRKRRFGGLEEKK